MKRKGIFITLVICLIIILTSCVGQPSVREKPTPIPAPAITITVPTPTIAVTIPATTITVTPPVPVPTSEPTPTISIPPPSPLPTSTVQLSEAIKEVQQSMNTIFMEYEFMYGGNKWTWELPLPESLFDYYKGLPRPPTPNYSVYVTHPLDDVVISNLVSEIERVAQEEGYSDYEKVEFANTFVQSLPYTVDSVTTPYDEYPRYPIETLVDNGGDCEDTSILLASLIDKMGYGVVLIKLPQHLAVGVKGGENLYGTYWKYEGNKYYYIETTGEGWGIGQLPEEYESTSATIYPLIPTPILTHEWSLEERRTVAELEVVVSNLGTATAYNVSILAGFDAGEDMLWNGEHSEPFQVQAGHQVTVQLNLRIPLNKYTRLVVQIGIDDVRVDESYTDWFDTN